eukprot:TRINITY_DN11201_c0_g1_i7.p1 TRINITY_DN11201_c0_g1~~TRINITY_DN11201_c0_g1_i7.p1  ORF type:complete len:179 (+),score=15.52 TRINITY_DN11201_c0_g1_i7:456-992(+)
MHHACAEMTAVSSNAIFLISHRSAGTVFEADVEILLLLTVKALVKQQRTLAENMGCCTHSAGQYCYVSTPDECTGLGQFHNDSVCYGPKCCVEPETWPGCVYPEQTPPGEDFDICRCQMTARPCCTGLLGDCSIKTQEQCEFLDGIFHANASSCAEVSCLDSVCGLSPFANEGIPDQW